MFESFIISSKTVKTHGTLISVVHLLIAKQTKQKLAFLVEVILVAEASQRVLGGLSP